MTPNIVFGNENYMYKLVCLWTELTDMPYAYVL